MNKNNLVSIIIPTFNSSKFILETLDSVINQTYKEFEIIIIDDYSTDDTIFLVETYLKKQNISYKILKSKSNKGVAVARNRGIKEAKGEYVAFLDSDDLWDKNKLEKQVNFMKSNNYYFSFTNQYSINEEGSIIKSKNKIKQVVNYKTLLKRTYISTSSVVININKIGKFEMPNYRRGQDYATWIMLLRNIDAYGLNQRLLKYRVSRGSLSSNKFDNLKQIYTIQREQEGINRLRIYFNIIVYLFYGVKKTLFRR